MASRTSRCGDSVPAAFQRLRNCRFFKSSVSHEPSTTKLPTTSSDRIAQSQTLQQSNKEETVLYLAYGSNLSAETFKGNRGIKPLSAVNVHVPSLDLTFSLPGIPYTEPCFANTRYRKPSPPPLTANQSSAAHPQDYHKDRWHKGLIGVVYEVTIEDYRTIIATEGGGASYQDVIVSCYVLPTGHKTVDPEPSGSAFKAHTLLSPGIDEEGNAITKKGGRLLRPDPSYAQASARYLKLLTDGGEEHELPAEYMAYLYNLRPYAITTYRQRLGQAFFLIFWAPILVFVMGLGRVFADDKGRIPDWLVTVTELLFRTVWISYDMIYKPIFGDGERTIKGTDEDDDGDEDMTVETPSKEKSVRLI